MIVCGDAEIAICGGVETKIEAVSIAGFAAMRIVLSTTNDDPAGACRPFDKERNGFAVRIDGRDPIAPPVLELEHLTYRIADRADPVIAARAMPGPAHSANAAEHSHSTPEGGHLATG